MYREGSLDIFRLKQDFEYFREETEKFYDKEIDSRTYKGISGGFGSYSQRGGQKSMQRLRFPGGRITKEQMGFIAQAVEKYGIDLLHLTTCQTVQLHNLDCSTVCRLSREALDYGIITRGSGGDYPRNVMAPPLAGIEPGEYFDVLPYAIKASDFLLGKLYGPRLPRKLKVGFSSSPKNLTHATFRDLGFAARPDGLFDVYSGGGLGNAPKLGVLVAKGIDPSDILYHIQAMYHLFVTCGNYDNRAKARSRFMQDTLGGPEGYKNAYLKVLDEIYYDGQDLKIRVEVPKFHKKGVVSASKSSRIIAQKQHGLYAVVFHPPGGCLEPGLFMKLYKSILPVKGAELRLSPDQGLYIIHCDGREADTLLEITKSGADTLFSSSVACIGGSICQQGIMDSQKMLQKLICMEREEGFADGILPQIYIFGCPSSCGTHQTGILGLRGAIKKADGKAQNAFWLFMGGCAIQGKEHIAKPAVLLTENEVLQFFSQLGHIVQESGLSFEQWQKQYPQALARLACRFT